jgi:hypothetical protein
LEALSKWDNAVDDLLSVLVRQSISGLVAEYIVAIDVTRV